MRIKNLKTYKKVLFVIDMVNGFVYDGALKDAEIANTIPRQIELIKEYQKERQLVIFIKDVHEPNSVEHKRFNGLTHCLRGTNEVELVPELKPYEDADNVLVLEKNSTSLFTNPDIFSQIELLENVEEVDIVGCCTDICVLNAVLPLMNYYDQINKNVVVRVHEDAIETYDAPWHSREVYSEAAYMLMEQQGAVKVRKYGEMKYGKKAQ